MVEILRTAHGSNAIALLAAERPPLDELSPLNADDTEQAAAEHVRRRNGGTPGKRFVKGNQIAKGRKPSLCLMGVGLAVADPRHRSALRKANVYRQRRIKELADQHGGYVGAGPAAMLASSARALASSIVLNELGAEALGIGTAKSVRHASGLLALAARLADSSRQQELTAVALAEREGKARAGVRDQDDLSWLTGGPAKAPTSKSADASSGASPNPPGEASVGFGAVDVEADTTEVDS